jgi:hypothetical protein
MKKIYMLAAAAMFTTTAFAQNVANHKSVVAPTAQEQQMINDFAAKKLNHHNSQASNKKAAVDGRADYTAVLSNLLGSVVDYTYANPIMPDSTTFVEYTTSVNNVTTHAVGIVYDPADASYGNVAFTANDVVTVDSIFMDLAYWINNSAHTNDSLIFRVFTGNKAPAGPFEVASFTGISGFSGQIDVPFITYSGNASDGYHDGITSTPAATYGYLLTQADSAGLATVAIPTSGLSIPAGQALGVFVEFIPTSFASGDTTSLVNDTGKFNIIRPLALGNATGQDYNNFTGLANGSFGHNSINVSNDTRYNPSVTNTGNTDGSTYSLSTLSNSIYLRVSGNSTVGINELNNEVRVNVYPNPSNGVFNINLASKEANTASLSVKNIVGQTILNETVNVSGNTNHTISLADYSKGVYFLTVNQETVKLIVE